MNDQTLILCRSYSFQNSQHSKVFKRVHCMPHSIRQDQKVFTQMTEIRFICTVEDSNCRINKLCQLLQGTS